MIRSYLLLTGNIHPVLSLHQHRPHTSPLARLFLRDRSQVTRRHRLHYSLFNSNRIYGIVEIDKMQWSPSLWRRLVFLSYVTIQVSLHLTHTHTLTHTEYSADFCFSILRTELNIYFRKYLRHMSHYSTENIQSFVCFIVQQNEAVNCKTVC